jgi:hypothetical protein
MLRKAQDFNAPKKVFIEVGENLDIMTYEPEYPALKALGLIDIHGAPKMDGNLRALEDGKTEVEFSWSWLPNKTGMAIAAVVDSAIAEREAAVNRSEQVYLEAVQSSSCRSAPENPNGPPTHAHGRGGQLVILQNQPR